VDEIGGTFSTHGEMTNKYKILVRKPDGKVITCKLRRRLQDNIKVDLKRNI